MLVLTLVSLITTFLRAEQDGCCPCLDSSSSSSSSECSSESTSLKHEPICCNAVLLNYDFNQFVPMAGQGWEYFGFAELMANDGQYVSKGCAGYQVDSNPFNSWVTPNAVPWLDHYKWFLQTTEPLVIKKGDVLGVEWKTSVKTFRTGESPYPELVIQDNDLRLGAGLYLASDATTALNFGFILTNDRVYGLYMKYFDGVVACSGAWVYVIPLKARKACDINKLRLEFNEGCKYVGYQVDNQELYRIKHVGQKLANSALLVKEYPDYTGEGCGVVPGKAYPVPENPTYPFALTFGFGTATFLDWYPSCKDRSCRHCHFPTLRSGLLNLGDENAPVACSIFEGCPVPQSYYINNGTQEVYHIWGQGVEMDLGSFKVERYACYYE